MAQSACCPYKGPKFSSEHSDQVAHSNVLTPAQGMLMPFLASVDTHTHMHISIHKYTYM